jgi:hypothetical protein
MAVRRSIRWAIMRRRNTLGAGATHHRIDTHKENKCNIELYWLPSAAQRCRDCVPKNGCRRVDWGRRCTGAGG